MYFITGVQNFEKSCQKQKNASNYGTTIIVFDPIGPPMIDGLKSYKESIKKNISSSLELTCDATGFPKVSSNFEAVDHFLIKIFN